MVATKRKVVDKLINKVKRQKSVDPSSNNSAIKYNNEHDSEDDSEANGEEDDKDVDDEDMTRNGRKYLSLEDVLDITCAQFINHTLNLIVAHVESQFPKYTSIENEAKAPLIKLLTANIEIMYKYIIELEPTIIDELRCGDFMHPLFDFDLLGPIIMALYPPSSNTKDGNGEGGEDNATIKLMKRCGLTCGPIIEIFPFSPTANYEEINYYLEELSELSFVQNYYNNMRDSIINIQDEVKKY